MESRERETELARQNVSTEQLKVSIAEDAKKQYENEKRSKCISKVNSDPTSRMSTQETESYVVSIVCSDDIVRVRSNVPVQKKSKQATGSFLNGLRSGSRFFGEWSPGEE